MKELVSVIIPILNPEINPTEEKLLHHCLETLTSYPLIFITYEGADLSIIKEHNENIDVVHFPRKYFSSRQHLASLLLMEDFYDRFNWSEFLLVHELNSWIVRDELYYWCKQGYDYLKAGPVYNDVISAKNNSISRFLGMNEAEKISFANGYENNGLYLCRIERMTKALKGKNREAHQYRNSENLPNADSVFWDIEANRFWPYLRKPTEIVRNHFAQNAVTLENPETKNLPFALTGISRSNIQQLPYFKSLPEAD
ncbi:hypothetical protein FEM33_11060 [Dyadobacter flavalbus]|uniref:DUF5672 domain-containing protein n=1 Tax=Dyadobacter flavalbus TaxID=2579942 RepID=A0A5M8QXD3_9BACT|nr:DUF5672 family protein [Dyadobacter flavalbus]KAA6439730.1 hypothetical protein FEM33_11060 [Dyadobacter flavalbus]